MNTLGLPRSNHSLLYRAVVDALKSDETLSGVIKRWATWTDQGDAKPWVVPMDAELPSLEIVPWQGPDQWDGPEGFTSTLNIDLNIVVPDTNVENAFDLYAQVRRVLTARATQDALNAIPGYRGYGLLRLSAPQFAPAELPERPGGALVRLGAFGRIELPVDDRIESP